MKLKKIKKLCKNFGQISKTEIVDEKSILKGRPERVFLGTESAKYYISSRYWDFEPEDFADLWEISSKQQDKMFMDSEVANLFDKDGEIFRDSVKDETQIVPKMFSFSYGGFEVVAFRATENRIVLAPAAMFDPESFFDDETSFWLRENYIAIKKGLYLEGIVRIPDLKTSPMIAAAKALLLETAKELSEGEETDGE